MKKNILIICENEPERVALSELIQHDYCVLFSGGERALSLLRETRENISAIILDINRGTAGELTALSDIRGDALFVSLPVIVTASAWDNALHERAAAAGADGFLAKPFGKDLLLNTLGNAIKLCKTTPWQSSFGRDELTGLYNRESFLKEADRLIHCHESGFYVLSYLDVDSFKLINEQDGIETGDLVLKHIADTIEGLVSVTGGITCRLTADRFAILFPASFLSSEALNANHVKATSPKCINHTIRIRIGRYLVTDTEISVSDMYDRATLAHDSIRGRYDVYIADYCDSMRENFIREQQIVNDMEAALKNGEFEPWFQPQYNHATGALLGAEALIRWRKDGKIIPPYTFIPIFEQNGFIYEADKFIWRAVCSMLRRRIDEGKSVLPVSVNISRYDVFRSDFLDTICGLVTEFGIPADLLRLEITESAFSESTNVIVNTVNKLISRGFTVEIDDFGSGYSSLNTLKDVPASILKLDMRFFENTENQQRGGNIVESVVRMAKWLGMAVIAEGVEDKEQADYLKSIGCYYIQGYFYAKPMPRDEYEKLIEESEHEPKLTRLQTLKTLDNGEFWNPKSMETLIFNSYVGGACIFEYNGKRAELLRVNEQYSREMGGLVPDGSDLNNSSMVMFLDNENKSKVLKIINDATNGGNEASCEVRLEDKGHIEYMRVTVRLIARASERRLFYCVILNISKTRKLEGQLRAIIDNINGGVTATALHNNGPEIILANNQFYQNLGYDSREQYEAEVTDKYSGIHPDDRERVIKCFETYDGGKSRYTMKYRIIRRDGAVRYIRNNISVISLPGVSDKVQLSVANDVTDIHQAQKSESAAADKLSAVLNHAGNGITAIALKDTPEFIFANNKFFEIVGYTREQYRILLKKDLFTPIHPDDKETIRTLVTRANENGGSCTAEYRVISSNGSTVWVRSAITVTHLEGVDAPVQIAVFSDISAEKEASEQLKFLNESAHDILAQPDSNAAINKTLEQLMRYFDGDRAYVMEINDSTSTVDNTYEICASGITSQKDNLVNVPADVSQSWFVTLQKNENVVINDVNTLGDNEKSLKEMLLMQDISSLIVTPLHRDGVLVGFTGVDNPKKTGSNPERMRAFGDYIAILLTRRDLNAKIDNDHIMLKALMDDTPGAFVRMKLLPNGKFVPVYSNNGFTKLVGMTHETLNLIYGNDVLAGVHPDDRYIVSSAGDKMISEGEAESARFRVKKQDGKYLWLTMYGRMTKDVNGDTYLNVYYSDASQQMTEEEKQRNLLDNIPCGAALYEYDGQSLSVVHINKSYWRLVEREPVDYTNSSVTDVIHPDDRQIVFAEIEAGIRQNRNISATLRIICGDNSYKPFRIDAKATSEENGKMLLFAAYTLLDEQGISVQEMLPIALSTMMSSSEDLSFVMDKDLHYICCSRSDAEFLGLENERDIIGKTDYDLFDAKLASALVADDENILKTGEAMIDKTEQIVSHDGSIHLVSVSKYPIRDASGTVIGLYGISRDITAQRQKESQLKLLTDSIPGGLATFSINENGIKLLYFNDGFCKFSGYNRDEYEKIVSRDPLAFVFEEDKQVLVNMIRGFSSQTQDGHENGCVYRCHTRDGGYKWMSMKTSLSRIDETHCTVNVVQLDITEQQDEKERLLVSEQLNRIAIDLSGNIITRFDVKNRTLTLPDSFNPIFVLPHTLNNLPEEQISLGRVSPDTADAYRGIYESIIRGEPHGKATYKQNSSIGWRWLEAQYKTVFSSTGEPVSAVISFKDVSEDLEKEIVYNKWQHSLSERPEESFTLFRCNLSKSSSFDTWEGKLININLADNIDTFDERTEEFISTVHPNDRKMYKSLLKSDRLLAEYYRGHRTHTLEYRDISAGKRVRWLRLTVDLVEYPGSKDIEVYLMYESVDKEKKEALKTLELSEKDVLTGVYNRAAFVSRVEKLIESSADDSMHAFMMLDLDSFKSVNDTLGHAAGDEVLKTFANRLKSLLRCDDLIGRPGGDEFFVFMKNIPRASVAAEKANKFCSFTVNLPSEKLPVTASIGVALVPKDGKKFEDLYKMVDAALYKQKRNGKHGYTFVGE